MLDVQSVQDQETRRKGTAVAAILQKPKIDSSPSGASRVLKCSPKSQGRGEMPAAEISQEVFMIIRSAIKASFENAERLLEAIGRGQMPAMEIPRRIFLSLLARQHLLSLLQGLRRS